MNQLGETVRNLLILLVFCALSFTAYADTWVNGYVKRDGTYVSGRYRQDSNTTNHDNYSTQQNTNASSDPSAIFLQQKLGQTTNFKSPSKPQ